MIVSNREKTMLVITVVVLLYAVVACSLRKRIDAIRDARAVKQERVRLLAEYENLIAQRGQWEAAYAEKADLMPVFETSKNVETHWLGVLDRVATKNGLSIVRRQVGEERQVGDVFEMPVECKEWEGDLESLVKFLYDIHAEGAMLDIRRLFVRPATSGKTASLRGSFTLYCAYMRSDADPSQGKEP